MKTISVYFVIGVFLQCLLFNAINVIAEEHYASSTQVKLTASDAESNDAFGWSVAVAGDTAVVGAYDEDSGGSRAGAVYVYDRNETNAWSEIKKLTAADAQAYDEFGFSVAMAGDVAVTGAHLEDGAGNNAGAAYVFERNTGGANAWNLVKKLTAADAEAGDEFGISVTAAGDVVVVGSFYESSGGAGAGAAYIFERNAGGVDNWGELKKLVASDADAGDLFGWSVAVAGDVVVVGAKSEASGGAGAGAAYVFERNTGGTNAWGEVKKLTASDAEAGDYFAHSVSVAGNVAVVGAKTGDAGAGSAYVFERDAGGTNTWGEVKKLTASDAEANDNFGCSVSVAGDVAIVGSYRESTGGSNAGAAYIFQQDAGGNNTWGEVEKLMASDAQAYDSFGYAVAVDGSVAVVGAYGANASAAATDSGAAYIFEHFIATGPEIGTNALVFPKAGTVLSTTGSTNIVWDIEMIHDETDGTNVTIAKICVHNAETTNEVATVTNNVSNLLGAVPWTVPAALADGVTEYVLRFEAVNSISLTNSVILWDNAFTIVPEPAWWLFVYGMLLFGMGKREWVKG